MFLCGCYSVPLSFLLLLQKKEGGEATHSPAVATKARMIWQPLSSSFTPCNLSYLTLLHPQWSLPYPYLIPISRTLYHLFPSPGTFSTNNHISCFPTPFCPDLCSNITLLGRPSLHSFLKQQPHSPLPYSVLFSLYKP